MERARIEDVGRVRALVESGDYASLDAFLSPLHPADIADILQELDAGQQINVLKRLDTERAAEVLSEVDSKSGQALLHLLSDREVVALLEELPSDDAADLMSALPPEKTVRVEALLPSEDREEIQELLEFGPDTAGGLMQVERATVPEDATIQDAIHVVRRLADVVDDLQKVYVVRDSGELLGVLPVLDLIVRPPDAKVRDVMERNAVSVPVDMDQEQVAALFSKYHEFTLPVVDASKRLVGRITMDDIIDVIAEEASEDIAHIAGTTEEELGETSILKVSRNRLPWLITGFVGEIVGAMMMSQYEASLATFVVLAFFIPLIVGTAGNIGIQAAVVVVRELALGQVDIYRMGRRVFKELQVAFINGLVLGGTLFAIVLVWRGDTGLGALLWGSLLIVIFVAAFMGTAIPLLLQRWRVDPAIATGPFVTVSNDVVGMMIYLNLATAYLSRGHG